MLIEITGKFALFTRPELKAERYSYSVPTPAAIEGILKSVYWKPEMCYIIKKIYVINIPQFEQIFTNAQTTTATAQSVFKGKTQGYAYSKRSMTVLRNVKYVVDIDICLSEKSTEKSAARYVDTFKRRINKGQNFKQPCLGVREFPCNVKLVKEIPQSMNVGITELGLMLHHIEYKNDGAHPVFYRAVMNNGCINALKESSGEGGWVFESLVEFYDKFANELQMPKLGYTKEKIYYEIVIDNDGNLCEFNPLSTNGKGKIIPTLLTVPASVSRTKAIKANFLWDNEKYIFGLDNTEKRKERMESFKKNIICIMGEIYDEGTSAILKFLENAEKYATSSLISSYLSTDNEFSSFMVFRLKGEDIYIHERKRVKECWEKYIQISDEEMITCMVTGKKQAKSDIHPTIKGVYGSGSLAKLVSVEKNSTAFMSYGWQGLDNSPFGKYTVFKYTTALNYMLADSQYRVTIGDSTFVIWNEENNPELNQLVKSIMTGYTQEFDFEDLEKNKMIYVLQLKANASRIVVVSFIKLLYGEPQTFTQLRQYLIQMKNCYNGPQMKINWDLAITIGGENMVVRETREYYLGQLLALLDKAQREAVTSTQNDTGLADKYIIKASQTPASIFPHLLGLNTFHSGKLNSMFSKTIQDTLEKLEQYEEPFPKRLNNEEQCNFYMGYNSMCRRLYKISFAKGYSKE